MQAPDRRAGRGGGEASVIYTICSQTVTSSKSWVTVEKPFLEQGDVMTALYHLCMG